MIGIIDYNMGNIQSVLNAFEYIGASAKIIRSSSELMEVGKVVLPGVGAFGEGVEKLRQKGMAEALNNAVVARKKPFLGICLGMQLICKESFEFGHFSGLGWIDASVRRFLPEFNLRIPHIGWNNLSVRKHNRLIPFPADNDTNVYFVHSYFVDSPDADYVVATCNYGKEFVAAIEKGNIFATQFHPEKSQKVGLDMLRKFNQC